MNLEKIISENQRRNTLLAAASYDPITGLGCCGPRLCRNGIWLPKELLDECPQYDSLSDIEKARKRIFYDFEFWAASCVTIRDKLTGKPQRLILNSPQRRVLATMEMQRLMRRPIRLIMLKARQWGGSTLVQMYMAWMQIVRHNAWNSLICGHLRQSARVIKGMFSLMMRNYPEEMLDDEQMLKFRNYEGSREVQCIEPRDCLVITGTAVTEDASRGYNLAMAHLTEVAFWPDSQQHSPEDVMRSVYGTINRVPESVVVLESTANGVGNFFHTEWMRAQTGQSDKIPVFVPWHEIEIYRSPVRNVEYLWNSMDDYEHDLWEQGLTLEMIQWYHDKRHEAASHADVMAEFPTNATEAFVCSGHCVFDTPQLDKLRENCRPPSATGDIEANYKALQNVHFVKSAVGDMSVWKFPEPGVQYLVSVDVGGRSENSDYSVIAVFDVRDVEHRSIEVVAQWRGHIDHDLLAWKAAQIATLYNRALLVVECNSLLKGMSDDTNIGDYVLDVIARHYRNVYRRKSNHVGFFTDRPTKIAMVEHLKSAVRDLTYVERDHDAVNELMTYEQHGTVYQARKGHHDDIVMTRAIALWVATHSAAIRRNTISDDNKNAFWDAMPQPP